MDTLEFPIIAPDPRRAPPRPAMRRYRWAPRDRPPAAARVFVGLLSSVAMLITAALLLSDSAPGVLQTVFGERARQLWNRIDAGNRIGDASTGSTAAEITQPDFLVHLALWTIIAALVGIAIWTWRGVMIASVALAAIAIGLELAQGRYATTRAVEASDAAANLAGIALGSSIAACCFLAWSAVAISVRRLRSPRDLNSRQPGSLR